ncbi:cytochrome b/b6 domain-containing protein [Bacteroidota bacterium]
MTQKIYYYPIWIRLWHWLNALLCLLLVITGLSMQYSDPDSMVISFNYAVNIHNVCGVFLSINYLQFFIGNIIYENGKHYKMGEGFLKKLLMQLRFYSFGVFKGENPPFPINNERKFNPLQRFTYILIMYIAVPFIIISGWALLFPEIIVPQFLGISGVLITDVLHIITGFIISIFLLAHVYFCTMGTKVGSLFKGMISGWVEPH